MSKHQYEFEWPLIGNDHILNYLEKSLVTENVSGAYIFNGPDGLGKTTLALHFAEILLCESLRKHEGRLPCGSCPSCKRFDKARNCEQISVQSEFAPAHGDFHLVRKDPDKKNISIEQVRDLINSLNLSSFLNSYKIGLIKEAEALSLEAANALLKTLEEPKIKVVIILVSKDLELLPSTIISRSKIFNFHPIKAETIYDYLLSRKAPRSAAKDLSRLALGRPAEALKLYSEPEYLKVYQEIAKIFTDFPDSDVVEKFSRIEAISKAEGFKPEKIFEIWQGIIRDCLLLTFNQSQLIQHSFAEKEIEMMKNKYNVRELLNYYKLLGKAKEFLNANVNLKFILENISLSF